MKNFEIPFVKSLPPHPSTSPPPPQTPTPPLGASSLKKAILGGFFPLVSCSGMMEWNWTLSRTKIKAKNILVD